MLLFDLKKTSKNKIFDAILEKIPEKNDIYYIKHREETNVFRLRKDPKKLEKKFDVERSTLCSFDGHFQLLHADVGYLELLGKSASDPKYCLLLVDIFTSNIYVYRMKSRKSILNKMEIFYKEVEGKRKG